jgi:hypothetical protein
MAASSRPSYTSSFRSSSTAGRPGGLSIARVAPTIILVSLLLDIGLRFIPPSRVAFRAWEALVAFAPPSTAFVPNARYENPRSHGDLPNIGNLPRFRQYRHEIFTTDFRGFRDSQRIEDNSKPDVLLIGDSFGVGSGVSDVDSPGVRLASMLHRCVYNAAGRPDHRGDLDLALELIRRLGMHSRTVVWEISERTELPEGQTGVDRAARGLRFLPASLRPAARHVRKRIEQVQLYSPLEILLSRAYRHLQNDRILPNTPASNVFVAQLSNGQEMLVLATELPQARHPKQFSVDGALHIAQEVRKTGNDVLFLLVPDKYAVYLPLIRNVSAQAGDGEYTDHVAAMMETAGLRAVNLLPLFRKEAERALNRRETIYWADDSHWNQEGIQLAAQAVADRIELMRTPRIADKGMNGQ